jgi:DNA-binding transcriptional LysR family regulator
MLAVFRQPGSNTIETVSAIRKVLPAFQANLPASIDLQVHYDRSVSIRESIRRRAIHADPRRLPGDPGDPDVPAQPLGDDHPGLACPFR